MDRADVEMTVEAFQARMLPPICVRTGAPASGWIAVAAVWIPAWARWCRWLPVLLAVNWLTRRHVWGWVPASPRLAGRVWRVRRLGLGMLLAGTVLLPVGLAVDRPWLGWVGLGGQALAMAVGLLEPALSIEARLNPRAGTVVLRRVHPQFRAAVAAPGAREAVRARLEYPARCG
jgi:hypothetical protein